MTSATEFTPIAVIGYGCVFPPDARDAQTYWDAIVSGRSGIGETPAERWDWRRYYAEERDAEERTYCRLGGWVQDYRFPRMRAEAAGIEVSRLAGLNRTQLMILDTALQAAAMAGYASDRLRDGAVGMFVGNMLGDEALMDLSLGAHAPEFWAHVQASDSVASLPSARRSALREGFLAQVARRFPAPSSGQAAEVFQANLATSVARLLGVTGPAMVVDAACAAGLAVVDVAVRALRDGTHDTVLATGVLGNMNVTGNVCFAKIGGLSATHSSPLDAGADGLIPGEGAGTLLLRRLSDAVRDGDPIAGVIRGVATRCDGKGKAIYAPSSRGQTAAMRRALALAGAGPEELDHVETHATATPAGDETELASLTQLFDDRPRPARTVTLGSVKAQTGHTVSAAGMANVIKVLLGFQHGTVPPTHAVTRPPAGTGEPGALFRVVTAGEQWPVTQGRPRRALSNAFGFGGVNTSIVVEEYEAEYHARLSQAGSGTAAGAGRAPIALAVTGIGVVAPYAADAEHLDPARARDLGTGAVPRERRFPGAAALGEPALSAADRGRAALGQAGAEAAAAGIIADFEFPWRKHRIPPSVVAELDRAQLLAVEAADQALAAVGETGSEQRRDTGVFIGATCGLEAGLTRNLRVRAVEYAAALEEVPEFGALDADTRARVLADGIAGVRSGIAATKENALPGYMDNIVAGRISNLFDLQGPGLVIDDGTCSFGAALDIAARYLEQGECGQALVGGVHANLLPEFTETFARWLGEAGQDPADFVPAEGAAFILVKPLSAVGPDEPVLAVLRDRERVATDGPVTEPGRQFFFGADGALRMLDAIVARAEADPETELVLTPAQGADNGYRVWVGGREQAPRASAEQTDAAYLVGATLDEIERQLELLASGSAEPLTALPPDALTSYRLGIAHTGPDDLARKAVLTKTLLRRSRSRT